MFYVTKYKEHFKNHQLVHRYKCEKCRYQTKDKTKFINHLKNQNQTQATRDGEKMFKCEHCCYETKLNYRLQEHLIKHKSLDELHTYKCKECTFVTKYKSSFNKHLLRHKRQMYK